MEKIALILQQINESCWPEEEANYLSDELSQPNWCWIVEHSDVDEDVRQVDHVEESPESDSNPSSLQEDGEEEGREGDDVNDGVVAEQELEEAVRCNHPQQEVKKKNDSQTKINLNEKQINKSLDYILLVITRHVDHAALTGICH